MTREIRAWLRTHRASGYVVALGLTGIVTGAIAAIERIADVANISMLYLLAVMASAIFFGNGPAILASVAAIEAAWPTGERVMACVHDRPDAQRVLRRAWRMANRLQSDLLAVFVETPRWANASPEERRALEENLRHQSSLPTLDYLGAPASQARRA